MSEEQGSRVNLQGISASNVCISAFTKSLGLVFVLKNLFVKIADEVRYRGMPKLLPEDVREVVAQHIGVARSVRSHPEVPQWKTPKRL